MTIILPVLPKAEPANSSSSSLGDEETWSHVLGPTDLVRGERFSRSWALSASWWGEQCPQLSPFCSPTPVSHLVHPGWGNETQCCFVHFGYHESCPKEASTVSCSLGGATKEVQEREYPQTSPAEYVNPLIILGIFLRQLVYKISMI